MLLELPGCTPVTQHNVAQAQSRAARREVWADGCEELGKIVPLEVLETGCRMLHGFFQEASHLAQLVRRWASVIKEIIVDLLVLGHEK